MTCPRCHGGLLRGECIACGWSVEAEQDRELASQFEYQPNHREPVLRGSKNAAVTVQRASNRGCDVCKHPVTSGEHMVRCTAVWSQLQGRWLEA